MILPLHTFKDEKRHVSAVHRDLHQRHFLECLQLCASLISFEARAACVQTRKKILQTAWVAQVPPTSTFYSRPRAFGWVES